jgi:response regulator RpfG family c-di-GMP phosphodiesterase
MVLEKTKKGIILVVDDEPIVRNILTDVLENEGYEVKVAEDGIEALLILRREPPDLVITDMKMPRMGGMELLYQINQLRKRVTTIMMTGFASVETAVESIKQGAYDYIMKPFQYSDLLRVVEHAFEKQRLIQENLELKEAMSLYEISRAISTHLNMDSVLTMLLEALYREGDADAVGLCLRELPVNECAPHLIKAKDFGLHSRLERIINWEGTIAYLDGKEGVILEKESIEDMAEFVRDSRGIESLLLLPMVVKDKTMGSAVLLSFTRGYTFTEGLRKSLSILVNSVASAIENARLYEDIVDILEDTIKSFARTLDAKDKYASGHSERVTRYSLDIARAMGLPQEDIDLLAQAGILHDIGKIGISELLLNKKGRLKTEEYEETKMHPVIGRDILAPIDQFTEISIIIYHHHERYDGKGYPDGLKGKEIPLLSRIIAVADAYDAMTSTRAYREKVDWKKAAEEIKENSGTQFDPDVVDVFMTVVSQLDTDEGS